MLCKKVGLILVILILTCVFLVNNVLAMSIDELSPKYTSETTGFVNLGKELFGMIKNIAIISAVVVLAFIGLKFMFGSIEQKAEYKKSLLPLAIGVFVVMGATTITGVVWDLQGIGSEGCKHRVSCNDPSYTCLKCGKQVGASYVKHNYQTKYDGDYVFYRCTECGTKTDKI